VFVTAAVALHPQEPMLQQAALQVILELPAHETRQMPARGLDLLYETRIVFSDDPVKSCLFRPMAAVGGSGVNGNRRPMAAVGGSGVNGNRRWKKTLFMSELGDSFMLHRQNGFVCSKLARVVVGTDGSTKRNPAEAGFLLAHPSGIW
jgi:hypothetical protein